MFRFVTLMTLSIATAFAYSGSIECENQTADKEERLSVIISEGFHKGALLLEGHMIELTCAGDISYSIVCRSDLSDSIYDVAVYRSTHEGTIGTVELISRSLEQTRLMLGKIFCIEN